MLDLRLEYQGGGTFQTRNRLDFDLASKNLRPREHVRAKVTRSRSIRQNDFFHALIEAAHENQHRGRQFENWRHLKSWLLIECGHCDEVRISLQGVPSKSVAQIVTPIAAVLRQCSHVVMTSYDPAKHEMVLRIARSVAFDKTNSDAMTAIVDRVVSLICTEIVPGADPEDIRKAAKERVT